MVVDNDDAIIYHNGTREKVFDLTTNRIMMIMTMTKKANVRRAALEGRLETMRARDEATQADSPGSNLIVLFIAIYTSWRNSI